MFESKLSVRYWSCDVSKPLLEVGRLPSRSLRTLWFYALVPGVWTFGTCQGCGEGREQIWSAGEKLQGFGNWNSWAKKNGNYFCSDLFFTSSFLCWEKLWSLEKGMLLVQHLRPSLILGAFDPWNPTATPLGNPQALPVSRQLGATETEEFHQGFFCLTMEGECPEQSTDLAGLWGREGYARFEAQWWNRERKKSQWKVCCHGFS